MANLSTGTILGFVGSVLMICFAFTMNPILAIVGLSFLTFQAFEAKLWNLIILNLVSIGGFASQLL